MRTNKGVISTQITGRKSSKEQEDNLPKVREENLPTIREDGIFPHI